MLDFRDVIAADIGGTNIRLARVQSDGNIVKEVRAQADFSRLKSLSPQEVEQFIIETISHAAQPLMDKNISGFGIGFPGFFIGDSGVLASSPNIAQLKNFNLAEKLTHALHIPVFAQNDALCAAMGEVRFGAAVGQKNLLHITLGTGIGGGLILNHHPYTGENGMAMEFGHLRVEHGDKARLCGCGGKGCVEAYASATAICTRYAEATGKQYETKAIFEAATHNDRDAHKIIVSAGAYLGAAIAESTKLLDIRTVTISGGLVGAWSLLHPSIMLALNENLIPPLQGKVTILPSTLSDHAGLLGAAALVSANTSKTSDAVSG